VTARWVVDEVRPARDLDVTWQPISLFFKNEPAPDAPGYNRLNRTHNLLRVLEAARATAGEAAVEPLYWEFGRRIHHDQAIWFDPAEAVAAAGMDPALAAAMDDDTWDKEIRTRMDAGLALAGDNIGTPLIGFDSTERERIGFFGPVITRVPSTKLSLQLWDGMIAAASVPGFWELKRTRTDRPDFGARP
jgi:hypothetical protein